MNTQFPLSMPSLNKPVEFRVLGADGKPLVLMGGGGGGRGNNKFSEKYTFKIAGSPPATFETTFQAKVREEEVRFTLQNVTVPTSESFRDPKIPVGPRGSTQLESNGWTIALQNIELNHSKDPYMFIYFSAQPSAGLEVKHGKYWAQMAEVTDDLGHKIEAEKQADAYFSNGLYEGKFHAKMWLGFPDSGADRLARLKGAFPVLMLDETHTVEFELPADKASLGAPVAKGPVTLLAVDYAGDDITAKYQLDPSIKCANPPYNIMYQPKIIDSAGAELAVKQSGRVETDLAAKTYTMLVTCKMESKAPARLSVWYCNKLHPAEIPFDFKDIGLPRKIGKWDVDKSQF